MTGSPADQYVFCFFGDRQPSRSVFLVLSMLSRSSWTEAAQPIRVFGDFGVQPPKTGETDFQVSGLPARVDQRTYYLIYIYLYILYIYMFPKESSWLSVYLNRTICRRSSHHSAIHPACILKIFHPCWTNFFTPEGFSHQRINIFEVGVQREQVRQR